MYNGFNLAKSNQVYRINPRIVIENFDDGALALRLEDRHMFELNTTASDVLSCTNGIRAAGEVASALVKIYEITQAEALQDVLELYDQLIALGVVETVKGNVPERSASA